MSESLLNPQTPNQPTPNKQMPNKTVRAALLGAVAVLALGGALGAVHIPQIATSAHAEAPLANAAMPSFADTIQRVRGAVVSVKVNIVESANEEAGPGAGQGMPRLQPGDPLERFFRRFGEEGAPFQMPNQRQQQRRGIAQGSGFIISSDGYVVTNNHVVKNARGDVTLTLDGGKTVTAKVIGTDEKTDLALLKINEAGTYQSVELSSTSPRVGDWVVAIGNPFGLGGTVTAGIVSARGRDIGAGPYDDFLQIDAPVNRGNSGGPTFDTSGRVVGVNTAIYSPSGGSVGIGFAIPSSTVKDVIAALRDKGVVARGYMGVQIQPVTPEIADSLGLKDTHGALVADTQNNTPAAKAGLKSGDVIISVDGESIDSPRELSRRIAGLGPEHKVNLAYLRGGKEMTTAVVLEALPDQRADARQGRSGDSGNTERLDQKFGLSLAPASEIPGAGREGVVVAEVDPNGAGATLGLRAGDIILEAAGQPVTRPAQVSAALADAKKAGRKAVLLRVKSGDSTRFVALVTNPAS
ncbi:MULTISPECIES: Do family serine endopeptidase [unclassified Beijerinckia]|uniref:Do family serine endopeptidase n=1 Tax=unclassified Beijerinckia TaxID=2638183 RepID=UPI00089CC633|nr:MULTISPECIES: Do family serine endopeptidase [unclassified Beijerinckia]MDH7796338.1 serine protease Do [Beijerinckia sp. GAS462]SEC40723.1 serine protease Do [Beijerinckia sp. 28-YEA-48]